MGIESLEIFKNGLGDVVRPNRFLVEMFPPSIMTVNTDLAALRFNVKSAVLPSKTFGEFDVHYMGQTYRIPGDLKYEDLSVTFVMEDSWETRDFFEDWNDLILDMSDNTRTDAIELLADSSILVHQIGNRSEEILASYRFDSVFPKIVGEVELSQDAIDRYEEFRVVFSYSYWTRINRG
jgi:hypothetical protein